MLNTAITNELEKLREHEQIIDRGKMLYKWYKATYNFTKLNMMWTFGDVSRNGIFTMNLENDEW